LNIHEALIGMGSNIEPELNLRKAAKVIRRQFPGVCFSRVYRSAAVGMDGDDFLNACCLFETDISCSRLIHGLKQLEDAQGRRRAAGAWQPRTLDLDMLMFDGGIMDDNFYKYAHIYIPASELVDIRAPASDPEALSLVSVRL